MKAILAFFLCVLLGVSGVAMAHAQQQEAPCPMMSEMTGDTAAADDMAMAAPDQDDCCDHDMHGGSDSCKSSKACSAVTAALPEYHTPQVLSGTACLVPSELSFSPPDARQCVWRPPILG
ncbi:hypothetical protein ACTSKR_08940 [Chitinibacteraceae bacterium HSL-7]